MKFWLISDTHFEHDRMIELCNRPENFTELIVENWNSMIAPEDTVIHLGDVSWVADTYMDRLNGKKILVRGNHDGKSVAWYMEHGFDFVCKTFTMKFGGLDIIFSHKPLIFHEHDICIHGHLHNCAKVTSVCPHYLVALEDTDYKPILLNDLVVQLKAEKDARENA